MSWELTDERGSVLAVTTSSGTVVDSITYDAFGNITSETNASLGGRMKYDGMQYDAVTKGVVGSVTGVDPDAVLVVVPEFHG